MECSYMAKYYVVHFTHTLIGMQIHVAIHDQYESNTDTYYTEEATCT